MYCRFCGKELEENEICMCEQNNNKTVMFENPVPDKNKMKDNRKLMVIIALAAVLIVAAVFGVVKIVNAVEKKKAYKAIESQAMAELDEIMGDYEIYTSDVDNSYEKYYAAKTDTGLSLSKDLFDFTIKLDDIVYAIPMDIKTLLGNGWTFDEYFDDFESPVNSEYLERSYLLNGDNRIDIAVYNYSGNQEQFCNCPLGSISYDFSGSLDVYLADDFHLNGKTAEEVLEKFGEPYMMSENVWCEIIYQAKDTYGIYNRYTLKFNSETRVIEEIDVYNFVDNAEGVENNASDTSYLLNYKAPASLGNNILTPNVYFMGDLYSLPAPVSKFIEDGWKIVESKSIGAGSEDLWGITMTRNGVTATFGVRNFSKYQVDAKDAAIYTLSYSIYNEHYEENLEMILPGNIKIGTSHSELKAILSEYEGFTMNEGNTNYNYVEVVDDITISIMVSKETETVYGMSIGNKSWNY